MSSRRTTVRLPLDFDFVTDRRAGRGLRSRICRAQDDSTSTTPHLWMTEFHLCQSDGPAGIGHRSIAATPLMREDEPIGVFADPTHRSASVHGKQIELIQTFADQAVIAIENVRLFDEVRAKHTRPGAIA